MASLVRGLSRYPGAMRKSPDEEIAEWLTRLLTKYCASNDSGSRERAKVVRRVLRKGFPESFETIDDRHKYSSSEMSHLRRSRSKHTWVLKCQFTVPDLGYIVPAGAEVISTSFGFALQDIQCNPVVPSHLVRKLKRAKSHVTAVTSLEEVC